MMAIKGSTNRLWHTDLSFKPHTDLDLDLSIFMSSILLPYKTHGLIIFSLVSDVTWYYSEEEDILDGHIFFF